MDEVYQWTCHRTLESQFNSGLLTNFREGCDVERSVYGAATTNMTDVTSELADIIQLSGFARFAGNFVRTLKFAMTLFCPTSFVELDREIDNLLMRYRNAAHPVIGKSPALLYKSRSLRTSVECCKMADARFFEDNDLRRATEIILSSTGRRVFVILDLDDLSCHPRLINQVEFNIRSQSVNGIPAVSNTNRSFVDDLTVPEQNVIFEEHTTCKEPEISTPRRSKRLRSRPPLNYTDPYAHSRCGGYYEHD